VGHRTGLDYVEKRKPLSLPGHSNPTVIQTVKNKTIPITGRCEMLGVPHCLDNRVIDGGKAVSPTHRPHFTPQIFLMFPVLISVRG
jgi:hypothetical protein